MTLLVKGITRLSELKIDSDKDWQGHGISNLKEVAEAMEHGDITFKAASTPILIKLPPSHGVGAHFLHVKSIGGGKYQPEWKDIQDLIAYITGGLNRMISLPVKDIPVPGIVMGVAAASIGRWTAEKSLSPPVPTVGLGPIEKYDSENPAKVVLHDEGELTETDYTAEATSNPVIDVGFLSGADGQESISATTWGAQTFKAGADEITVIRLVLWGYTPGQVTVSIRAVDEDGKPTGEDLASGTYDGNQLTDAIAGALVDISLDTAFTPVAGTTYAIVVRSASSTLYWRKNTAGGYADGKRHRSTNSGSTWTSHDEDFMFQVLTQNTLDVPVVSPSPGIGDALYSGRATKFNWICYWINQAGEGTYTTVNLYWNGAGWVTLPLLHEQVTNWKQSGKRWLIFEAPEDWATTEIGAVTQYWIKTQIETFTNMPKIPKVGRIHIGGH